MSLGKYDEAEAQLLSAVNGKDPAADAFIQLCYIHARNSQWQDCVSRCNKGLGLLRKQLGNATASG